MCVRQPNRISEGKKYLLKIHQQKIKMPIRKPSKLLPHLTISRSGVLISAVVGAFGLLSLPRDQARQGSFQKKDVNGQMVVAGGQSFIHFLNEGIPEFPGWDCARARELHCPFSSKVIPLSEKNLC
ncbi:hypothetical protein AVEN_70486-1 [Araneus ventricosus]|uniref:Uncharacterized protein n=1 Tax=Araneus ventricosus TaxID=182803 RepID=A0A4Y2H1G2_ARAVE|nr:hypothetical protein AVEN_70486-1 [Araneus ventricosus]